jgi:hypothetical protein
VQSRAWVFQERYLARRTIGFAASGMYWTCRTLRREETGRYSSSSEEDIDSIINAIKSPKVLESTIPGLSGTLRIPRYNDVYDRYFLWASFIEQYTSSAITKPRDRLPALAGLVGEIASKTQQRSYAGIWERAPTMCLSWQACNSEDLNFYRAPSWSWYVVWGLRCLVFQYNISQ